MKSIFIFRRDFRLRDNTSLNLALSKSEEVIPIFIFDPKQVVDNEYRSDNAIQFMVHSLIELHRDLERLGSGLKIYFGDTLDVLESIILSNSVEGIFFNRDYTPFSKERDTKIMNMAKSMGINCYSKEDYTLNSVESVKTSKGYYKVFTPYYNAVKDIGIPKSSTNDEMFFKFSKKDAKSKYEIDFDYTKNFYSFNENIAVKGGRKEALAIFKENFDRYSYTRDIPFLDTTKLSAHIKFGTVSIREAAFNFRENESLLRQIYWRDFWSYITYYEPNVIDRAIDSKFRSIKWSNRHFDDWKEGKTGIPIIDAGMKELNTTGWMHNRVRMLTASFLVKNLLVDWRLGAKYFAQKLVDYCPMQNQNNWQSILGSGIGAQPWFRVMNPLVQQEKFDPDCRYIKRWIPELRNLDPQSIHNGVDYISPIIDLKSSREQFISMIKQI